MPLDFSPDASWPPRSMDLVTPKLAEWAAWYEGSPEALGRLYGNSTAPARPSERRGGIVGSVKRMFWGTPTPAGQPRTKLHIPLAADIATASADLLFGEAVDLQHPEGVSDTQTARLDYVLEGNSWHSLLLEAAEVTAALSGCYLRVAWDTDVADHPISSVVHADAAVPEFRWGRLVAVTFWETVSATDTTVLRHLERHEPGHIYHGLYQGTPEKLGRLVPIAEHPSTAGLELDAQGGVAVPDGVLTACYVPNIRPNRMWRSDPLGSNLGRSDFAGVEPEMDALDETWTSWMRDIRLGKGRVIVPEFMLRANRSAQGTAVPFNLDQEVFVGMASPPADDVSLAQQMTVQQFTIRTAEHSATAVELTRTILRTAGYSAQTFGIADEGGMATATEVNARQSRSLATREKKTRYWTDALRQHLRALIAVDAMVFPGAGMGQWPEPPTVVFPAGATPSLTELSGAVNQLNAAQAVSTATKVDMLHPDWDDTQKLEEVGRILQETSLTTTELFAPPEQGNTMDPEEIRQAADAMGVLIRAGVEPEQAAERVGLAGIGFTGAVPTSLRLPEADAAGLESGTV